MPTVSADDIVGYAPGTRGRTVSHDDIAGLADIPSLDPQVVTSEDFAPTPEEQSTLAAPEGSPAREEINRAVAGNIFAPPGAFAREPTLAEAVQAALPGRQRDQVDIPLRPPEMPLPEQGGFEQGGILGATMPGVEAAGELAGGMMPHDWQSYLRQIYLPFAAYQQAKDIAGGDVSSIPLVGRVPEIIAADKTPAFSKERFLTTGKTLMDLGALAGAGEGGKIPLRAEPLAPEAPPTRSLGPGTIADDVSKAIQQMPPETPPLAEAIKAQPTLAEQITQAREAPVAPPEAAVESAPGAAAEPAPAITADPRTGSVELRVKGFTPSKADYPEGRSKLVEQGLAGKIYLEHPKDFDTENPPPRDFMVVEDALIANSLQNQGYGTQLYNEALRLAKSQGYKGIASHEADRNIASDSLWKKIGQGKKNGYDTITDEITRATQAQPDVVPTVPARAAGPAEAGGAPKAQAETPAIPAEDAPYAGVEPPAETPVLEVQPEPPVAEPPAPPEVVQAPPQAVSDQPHVSAIANRFKEEKVARGELGEIAPGGTVSTTDLVAHGLKMTPERVNDAVSRVMQGGDVPIHDVAALRGEEARLSQRSNELSRAAGDSPEAQLAADNALKDLNDFWNGPIAQAKRNWHLQGKGMQGEIPVDLSTLNGHREAWFKDHNGQMPPKHIEPKLQKAADRLDKAIKDEQQAAKNGAEVIDRVTSRKKLPTYDEVANNISERLKVDPCII